MFGMQENNELPICGDIAVDKHQYHVHVTWVDSGGTVLEEVVEAGSVAHAAALVGMLLYAKNSIAIMTDAEAFANFAHNMGEHVNVNVKLIG